MNLTPGGIALITGAEYCEENIGRVVKLLDLIPAIDEDDEPIWEVEAIGAKLFAFAAFDRFRGEKTVVTKICVHARHLCLLFL